MNFKFVKFSYINGVSYTLLKTKETKIMLFEFFGSLWCLKENPNGFLTFYSVAEDNYFDQKKEFPIEAVLALKEMTK